MSLVGLAIKNEYGNEIRRLDSKILEHIYGMAQIFKRFETIKLEVLDEDEFTNDDINEIVTYLENCYRKLMYASLGAHDMEEVGGIPVQLWDEVGLDIRPILEAVGKWSSSSSSTSFSSSSESSSESVSVSAVG